MYDFVVVFEVYGTSVLRRVCSGVSGCNTLVTGLSGLMALALGCKLFARTVLKRKELVTGVLWCNVVGVGVSECKTLTTDDAGFSSNSKWLPIETKNHGSQNAKTSRPRSDNKIP
ncbi:hypothetical protein GN244_ATG08196 [Phytophthora infestans]|uniref:Uncharacterized protein n=1 Tax=Phytophthora infestans TaxID=4787 RepID=A0A833S3J4_PHYIN|nr:hypothetical protein GN244_ATG08196 [Phytophthora infestans]